MTSDWAYERFSFSRTMTPTGGGEPTTARGKGIHVYRRQSDGSWKLARDLWNSDEAAGVGDQLDGGGVRGDGLTRSQGPGGGRVGPLALPKTTSPEARGLAVLPKVSLTV